MYKKIDLTKVVAAGTLVATMFISCNKETGNAITPDEKPISTEEINDLLQLREEEKLARDVYIYSYNKYGNTIFNNISKSEQKHMDKVLEILNEYDIPDPASAVIGEFNDEKLQDLYDDLIMKSDKSLIDALLVGATVEDVDIYDINEFISGTQNKGILDMYEKLNCGSRNHMRRYYSQILSYGSDYTPQFISIDSFNDIINGKHKSCGNSN